MKIDGNGDRMGLHVPSVVASHQLIHMGYTKGKGKCRVSQKEAGGSAARLASQEVMSENLLLVVQSSLCARERRNWE